MAPRPKRNRPVRRILGRLYWPRKTAGSLAFHADLPIRSASCWRQTSCWEPNGKQVRLSMEQSREAPQQDSSPKPNKDRIVLGQEVFQPPAWAGNLNLAVRRSPSGPLLPFLVPRILNWPRHRGISQSAQGRCGRENRRLRVVQRPENQTPFLRPVPVSICPGLALALWRRCRKKLRTTHRFPSAFPSSLQIAIQRSGWLACGFLRPG